MRHRIEGEARAHAAHLVRRDGPLAADHAVRNAERHLAEANVEGAATWLLIARHVKRMLGGTDDRGGAA